MHQPPTPPLLVAAVILAAFVGALAAFAGLALLLLEGFRGLFTFSGEVHRASLAVGGGLLGAGVVAAASALVAIRGAGAALIVAGTTHAALAAAAGVALARDGVAWPASLGLGGAALGALLCFAAVGPAARWRERCATEPRRLDGE